MTPSPSPSVDEVAELAAKYANFDAREAMASAVIGGNAAALDALSLDIRRIAASLVSPPKAVAGEPLTDRLAAWFNSLPDGGMGKEHFDALLSIVANHEARGDGVMVTDEQVKRAQAELNQRGFGLMSDTVRAALEAALPPLGDGRAEIVEACAKAAERAIKDAAVPVPSGPFMDERLPSRPALCKIVRDAILSLEQGEKP